MTAAVAGVLAGIFVILALIHIYWAFGGRLGKSAAIPELGGRAAFVPGRIATFAVAVALVGAAFIVAAAGGLFGGPERVHLARILTAVIGAGLIARAIGDFRLVGFFKRERAGAFARLDTIAYSPLCLALGIAALLVARGVG
jgi:hypothetical protein